MRSKRCGGLQLIAAMQKTINADLCAQIKRVCTLFFACFLVSYRPLANSTGRSKIIPGDRAPGLLSTLVSTSTAFGSNACVEAKDLLRASYKWPQTKPQP